MKITDLLNFPVDVMQKTPACFVLSFGMAVTLVTSFYLGSVYGWNRGAYVGNAFAASEFTGISTALDLNEEGEVKRIIGLAVDYHVGVLRSWHDSNWLDRIRQVQPLTRFDEKEVVLDLKVLRYYNSIHPLIQSQDRDFLVGSP